MNAQLNSLPRFAVEPNGKRPLHKGWQAEASATPDIPDGCNVGISTSHGLLVVDIDVKHGKNGNAALLALELQGFDLPDTFAVATPSGGTHYYYSVESAVRQGANVLGPGVDIRSRGGYVLAPGSKVDGRPYTVAKDLPIAPAPAWLVERCGTARQRKPASTAPVANLDAARAQARAVRYLADEAPLAIEGSSGDDTTYKVACRLKDFGLGQDDAYRAMAEHWNPRCSPPWDDDGLMEKVEHAYAYGIDPPGVASPEADFGPVVDPDAPVPFGELLRREPRPVAELVPGLIEKGIPTFLDGPGGSCKSRLALQLGLCLAAGVPVFGRMVEKCRFVHLSSEDGADEVTRRTHAIAKRLELPGDVDGVHWDRKDKDSALAEVHEGGSIKLLPFHGRLVDYLRSIPGHKFVVIDSIYDFVRYVGHAKVDEGSVNAFIKRTLGGLCTETDSTLLVIRHPSQAGAERGDMSGWSVANHNAPRARLSMAADKSARDAYVLKVEKRNHGACCEPITLHWSDGALLPRTELQASEARGKLYDAVLAIARSAADAGAPITKQAHVKDWQLAEIEKATGIRPTQKEVREELSRAAVSIRSLVYIPGDAKRAAGYYPAENADERARKLRRGVKTGVKTG